VEKTENISSWGCRKNSLKLYAESVKNAILITIAYLTLFIDSCEGSVLAIISFL
jgi:hypothetical protein